MDSATSPARPRGRRPLDPRVRRTDRAVARLNQIEREQLDAKLAELGLTESAYVRQRLGFVDEPAA